MKIKKDSQVIKGISSLDELIGIGEESFRKLGGGEAFLENERKGWNS